MANITYRDAAVNTLRVRRGTRAVNNWRMALNEQIRRLRKKAGLTQEDLALLCGFNGQSRLANYEKGARTPSVEDLKALAKGLGVHLLELLEEPMPDSSRELEQIKIVLGAILTATAKHRQAEAKDLGMLLRTAAAALGDAGQLNELAARLPSGDEQALVPAK